MEEQEITNPVEEPKSQEVEEVSGQDITDIIGILNEFQKISGGTGEITDIPENLRGAIRFAIEKMVALRQIFEDDLFNKIIDDMVDQREDGKTPSVLVAVARNIPLEDLQDIADNENYEEIQGAVEQRLADKKQMSEKEDALYADFQTSQKAGKSFCEKMGYDEAQTNELFKFAMGWFKILGDGKITEEEWAKIDKMRNYDTDIEAIKGSLPPAPVKEVLPDKGSTETFASTPQPAKQPVKNNLEMMAESMGTPPYIKQRGSISGRGRM